MPQSGAITSRSGGGTGTPAAPARRRPRRSRPRRRQVDHAQDDRLVRQVGQHAEVEPGLRGLDRDLVDGAAGQLGQEQVARRALVDDRRVAEAQVHRGRPGHAVERRGQRGEAVGAGGVRAGLQVRLVDLDDVRPGRVQVADLGVDRRGVVHRRRLEVRVVVVLRLLAHGERPGHGHLHRPVGVRAQELQVAHLHRVRAADRPDDAGHRVRVPSGPAPSPGLSRSSPSSAVAKWLE